MTSTPRRMSGPRTIVFTTSDDVRAAVSSDRVARLSELLESFPLDGAAAGGATVDTDIDADLPLPAACFAEWTQVHELTDRLRAFHLLWHARMVLARVLRSEDGADRIDDILRHGTGATDLDDGEQSGTGAFGPMALAVVVDDDRTMEMLQRLPEPEDQLTYNTTLKTQLSAARRESGRALAAYLGTPRILSSAVEVSLAFNKLDRLLFRSISAQLTLHQMNEVDEFASELVPTLSLDQFDKRVRQYILTYLSSPATSPESIYERRGVDFRKFPDGSGVFRAYGPGVDLEALYQRHRATGGAISTNEMSALDITPEVSDALRLGSDGQVLPGSDLTGADVTSIDERRISQLMFDTLVSSVPQTRVRVIRKSDAAEAAESQSSGQGDAEGSDAELPESGRRDDESGARDSADDSVQSSGGDTPEDCFLVTVSCPTTGSWLRKQAAVTVTMSLTTLAGLDDDPATLGLSTPLPAAQARQVASKSTVWRRILYDPADGTITDEATRTYTPTASMRRAVEQKWRTCVAPGCSRNASRCEIDHCEPFCHDDPGRGGPTHPSNLIPLCVLHHQLKTNGVIRLRRVGPDDVEWVLPLGVVARTSAPSAVTDGRRSCVPEEVLGLRLRSSAFDGPAVTEALFGRQRCADFFEGGRSGCRSRAGASRFEVTVDTSRGSTEHGHTDDGQPRRGPDDDPPPF